VKQLKDDGKISEAYALQVAAVISNTNNNRGDQLITIIMAYYVDPDYVAKALKTALPENE
jgi:hypothetical protein